jgi:hypothetical protein
LVRRIVPLFKARIDVGIVGLETDVERLRVPDDARGCLLLGAVCESQRNWSVTAGDAPAQAASSNLPSIVMAELALFTS